MRVAEAHDIARGWFHDVMVEGPDGPGVCGGFVMGSLAAMDGNEAFDERASDIDIAVVIDGDVVSIEGERYRDGKIYGRGGAVIQALYLPVSVLGDADAVLGMLGLGSNLRHGRLLADPAGVLATARALVERSWADPKWVRHRTDRAIGFATDLLAGLDASDGESRLWGMCDIVTQLAGIVAIASCVTPTHRKALVKVRPLLEEHGAPDLYQELVSALVGAPVALVDVNAAIADAITLLEIELTYDSPLLAGGPDLVQQLRVLGERGLRQIVDEGNPTEALLPTSASMAASASMITELGSTPARTEADRVVTDQLVRLGAGGDEWAGRLEGIRAVAERVFALVT